MHRLADRVVAAERERHVADAATHHGMRQALLDEARRLDEIEPVRRVLLDAGRDRENVRIEYNVLGRETDLLRQHGVGALANGRLALDGIGLALLIERHHHHGGAVGAHLPGLFDECRLPFLEADRVDDPLALHAFETGLDHRPLGRVDHHRHAGDIGLCRNEIEEAHHGRFRIEHTLVHVDVDHLRAGHHLLASDVDGGGVIARLDELAELGRSRDVGPLADVDEQRLSADSERFKPGESALHLRCGRRARR